MKKQAVLCVDDERLVLTSLTRELHRMLGADYLIETSEDGEDALDIFQELISDGYDVPLVISDYIMPRMKGDELLRRVHDASPKTLTIMLTGQADMDGVTRAINYANLYRFIAKPWHQSDLSLTVKEALRSYAQARQLEEHYAVLENMNVILEQQVKERTVELEARHLELQEKNTQLHASNASKDKFFSIISHDLRSPLSTLLGFAQLLSEQIRTAPLDQVAEYACKICNSAERLNALLENLLSWSRLQRGVMEHCPDEISLYELIEDNLALFASKAESKHIWLSSSVGEEVRVYADYQMVNTVARNLLSNALKFSRSGDSIQISATISDRHVEIAVADTGPGIPAEDLPKLFRVDSHYTNIGTAGEAGTGLGLLLCQEMVEKNSGSIWVESEAGKGTTFRFTLPKAYA
ncbi:response regulator receiver sensor signal transduction histidine kinase [Candidatus Moduliflexus flocculans]|uniref:histidine kinase n=1 Tax=Candidatus Moduliflexus flocculans TaxID=1499966 RepID=A0A0S6VUJ3_9BACT|nr:response regulator receiver sensor signal transduction histidine kinase [Candidatus Moduliflexus flocculans]